MSYVQIRAAIERKYDIARASDYAFELEHYEWILGGYIIDELYREMEIRPMDIGVDGRARLWGLPIILDRYDKWRISLVKEIE